MRIAFISSIVPDGRPSGGFEVANEAILEGLRSLGHTVEAIGFALPRQDLGSLPDIRVIETMNLENSTAGQLQKLRWILQAFRTGLPVSASKLRAVTLKRIQKVIQEAGPFDYLIFNSYQMAAAFPELTSNPFSYVAHNVEYRTAAENARQATSPVERFLHQRDARLLKQIEKDLCERSRHVWVLAREDAETLSLSPDRSSVLPLVVPHARSGLEAMVKGFDFGMVGTWTWAANRIGLDWFLSQVVPRLPASVSIAIAGARPRSLAVPQNVTLLGRIEDADQFIRSVRVVPLVSRGGTGVQLKTVEAFQAGLPCVATSSSLRGIAALPANCRRADEPEAFAAELMGHLQREKDGLLPQVDGSVFRREQLRAMENSLKEGLRDAG